MRRVDPTIKFYTLGCKVNQYETEKIREGLVSCGFKEVGGKKRADIYIINTCTVTGRADSDSLKAIRRARRENPAAKVVVTGCLSELDQEKIRELDGVQLIVKHKNKDKISAYLSALGRQGARKAKKLKGISSFAGHTRAFLKVQDGCNNRCSYCRVPLARGGSVSRSGDQIIQEARQLAEGGFKEIVLTGICLGAYGRDLFPKEDLVGLIDQLEEIRGLSRIRLSSIEAVDVTDKLIEKLSGSPKLCKHLHIPLQSGDNTILKKMNRKYTGGRYLRLIKKIKKMVTGISITTDCMVGFPGEGEKNFLNTLRLIKEICPLRTHIFIYSPREGTAAFGLKQEIRQKELKQRFSVLQKEAFQCAKKSRGRFIGKEVSVLIESHSKDNPKVWQGYSDNYIRVTLQDKRNLKNRIIKVRLDN